MTTDTARIDLLFPMAAAAPRVLHTAAERIAGLMRHALRFLELHGAELLPARERRRMTPRRIERRQACVLVVRALLKHMDILSLRVGRPRGAAPQPGADDLRYVNPPGQAKLCAETGLTLTRLRRAIRDLRRAGYMRGPSKGSKLNRQRRIEYTSQTTRQRAWSACRVVYVLTRKLFDRLGLGRRLEREQAKAYERARLSGTRIYAGALLEGRELARGMRGGSRETRPRGAPGAPAPAAAATRARATTIDADQALNQQRQALALMVRLRQLHPDWGPARVSAEAWAIVRRL